MNWLASALLFVSLASAQDDDGRRKRLSHPPVETSARPPETVTEFFARALELRRRAGEAAQVGDAGKIRELERELSMLAELAEMQAQAIQEAGNKARESAAALRWVLEHAYGERP